MAPKLVLITAISFSLSIGILYCYIIGRRSEYKCYMNTSPSASVCTFDKIGRQSETGNYNLQSSRSNRRLCRDSTVPRAADIAPNQQLSLRETSTKFKFGELAPRIRIPYFTLTQQRRAFCGFMKSFIVQVLKIVFIEAPIKGEIVSHVTSSI